MPIKRFVWVFAILGMLSAFSISSFGQQVPAKKHVAKKPTPKPAAEADPSSEKKDTVPEEKDTVKVSFGRDIVNLRTLNGWIVDDNKKWVSSPNRIPYTNPDYNNELYTKYPLGSENIKQINIVEVKIDSTPYLAFIIEQDKGRYMDKKDSDFRMFVGADYFLIHPADFLKLWDDSMEMGQPYEVALRSYYSGLVGYRKIELRPKFMSMEINKDIRNSKYTDTTVKIYLQFGFKPIKNKKGKFMRFNYGLAYARTGQPVPHFDFNVFTSRFFETDLELFHRFSRPKSVKPDPKETETKPDNPVRHHEEKPDPNRPIED